MRKTCEELVDKKRRTLAQIRYLITRYAQALLEILRTTSFVLFLSTTKPQLLKNFTQPYAPNFSQLNKYFYPLSTVPNITMN